MLSERLHDTCRCIRDVIARHGRTPLLQKIAAVRPVETLAGQMRRYR